MVPGDKPAALASVFAVMNETLKKEINTTIELKHVPWQMWSGQAEALIAAANPPDALYVSSGANYGKLASKNLLMAIDAEMVARYAPKMSEGLSAYTANGLRDCEVAGKAYMVPAVGNLWVEDWPVLIRGDLRAKYGMSEVRTLDDLDAYLKALGGPESGIVPWNADGNSLVAYLQMAWFQPAGMNALMQEFPFLAYKVGDKKAEVKIVLQDKTFIDVLLQLHSLAVAGALPENVLYERTSATQKWSDGKSACLIADLETISSTYDITMRDHPEWMPERCVLNPEAKRQKQPLNLHGMAIPAAAAEPERFLMALDLLYGTKELQDLSVAGLPGIHRETATGDAYSAGPDAAKYPFNEAGTWAWANRSLMMAPSVNGWYRKELFDKWTVGQDMVVEAELAAFAFDPSPVAMQLNALQTAMNTEGRFLLAGVSDTISTDVKTLQDAFLKAGIDDVRIEMQRQVDLYLKNR
jgi:putative aldouronate transport system substrate-binding protein